MKKIISNWFGLPPDLIEDLPRIEMIGQNCLRIENHRGLLGCKDTEIKMKTSSGSLVVKGESLILNSLKIDRALISGTIINIKYE